MASSSLQNTPSMEENETEMEFHEYNEFKSDIEPINRSLKRTESSEEFKVQLQDHSDSHFSWEKSPSYSPKSPPFVPPNAHDLMEQSYNDESSGNWIKKNEMEYDTTDSEDVPEVYLSFSGNRGKKKLVNKYHRRMRPRLLLNGIYSNAFQKCLKELTKTHESTGDLNETQKIKSTKEIPDKKRPENTYDYDRDPYEEIRIERTGQLLLQTLEQVANDICCHRILESNHLDQLSNISMMFIEDENRFKRTILRYVHFFTSLDIDLKNNELLYHIRSLILDILSCTTGTMNKLESVRRRLSYALEERQRVLEILRPLRKRYTLKNEHVSP